MFNSEKVLLVLDWITLLSQLFLYSLEIFCFTFLQGVLISWGFKVKNTKLVLLQVVLLFSFGADVIGNSTLIKLCVGKTWQELFLCNGIRWPLFSYLHQQFTVIINYLCALDTTLRILNT